MTYRTSSANQYNCPRCFRALNVYQVGAFVVDACLECGGLFIDNAASRELTLRFDRDLVTTATTLGIGKGEEVGPGVVQRDLACPKCVGPLAPVFLPAIQVRLDVCAEHGTWFDANELPKVARAYRNHPGGLEAVFTRDFIRGAG